MPKPVAASPATLRPYEFHGVRFTSQDNRNQCHATCPACGRDKFSVHIETGMFSCYAASCPLFIEGSEVGGSTKFLRWLWGESFKRRNGEAEEFAKERGIKSVTTLDAWGFCISMISGAWLVPGYSPDGGLVQLYKRIWTGERWEYRPTPDVGGHAMHGVPLYSSECDTVYLCEKGSDAACLWEVLRVSKPVDFGFEFTGNPAISMLGKASVLAVPNCGSVGKPLHNYLPLFKDKRVVLCFDSDHHLERDGNTTAGAGYAASKRATSMLVGVASEINWIRWGDNGVATNKVSGWDVRDVLVKGAM